MDWNWLELKGLKLMMNWKKYQISKSHYFLPHPEKKLHCTVTSCAQRKRKVAFFENFRWYMWMLIKSTIFVMFIFFVYYWKQFYYLISIIIFFILPNTPVNLLFHLVKLQTRNNHMLEKELKKYSCTHFFSWVVKNET